MAHSCPECGSACYCNGDIDDILIEDPVAERDCTCCLGRDDDDEPYDEDPAPYEEDVPKLGKCCICESEHQTVRNIVMLSVRALEPGIGCWGCLQCDLPTAGAVAVLCDDCLEEHRKGLKIVMACVGAPGENRRIRVSKLTEPFDHDKTRHEGEV